MNVLVTHIPHAIPVVAIWGVLIRYWLLQRRLSRAGDATPVVAPVARPAAQARPDVRRSVALRGLIALGPLIGALATGLIIYALNLGPGRAGQTAIWVHVGLSLLALLLIAYKIADLGLARLRESVVGGARSWRAGGSLVLLVLWVPLVVSGVALLIAPGEASFTAYAHLIASVWWTALLLWHLRRYLARATRAVWARPRRPSVAPAGDYSGRPRPVAGPTARPAPARRPAAPLPPPRPDGPSGESETAGVAVEDGAAAPASSH